MYHCAVCGQEVGLKKNGAISTHGYARTGPAKTPCAGSGLDCLEALASVLSETLATAPHAHIAVVLAGLGTILGQQAADRLHSAALALID